jgi:hypothetical protein
VGEAGKRVHLPGRIDRDELGELQVRIVVQGDQLVARGAAQVPVQVDVLLACVRARQEQPRVAVELASSAVGEAGGPEHR